MLNQRYTRLPQYQQYLVSILLGLFVILLVNSIVLLLFDRSTAAGYMIMVLMHVVLGVILLAPLLVFIVAHLLKMPVAHNRLAAAAGVFTALTMTTLVITGFMLISRGASFGKRWAMWIHIAATVLVMLGFLAHVSLKKGVRYHFLAWGELFRTNPRGLLLHPLSLTVFLGLAVSAIFSLSLSRDNQRQKFVTADKQKTFAPGQAVLAHENYLHDDDLSRSESCGQASCHPDIYKQWNESVHHFSSFNNPYYRASVELLVKEKGNGPARWCASCHDPLVLFPGKMPDGVELDLDHARAQAGITCLSCHAIEGLRDVKGNGRLVMAMPDEYPFARSENKIGQWIFTKLVKSKPEPHRRAMLKPMHKTSEFCGTCHKVGIPPEVNDYRWKRGQNQYDNWHNSGASGNIVRSFYLPPTGKSCTECHMPLVPSLDEGNDNGFVRSHRFATANTTLPMINHAEEQLKLVQKALQDSLVTVDLFHVEVNGKSFGPLEAMPALKPYDDVKVTVVARNRKVGHSKLIGRRNVQNWVATIYANVIGPGAARTVHYRFKVPPRAAIAQLEVKLQYRKFMQEFNRWVFRDRPNELPTQPVTTMATSTRQVGVVMQAARPLWERWNDYGIGHLLEGDTRRALEAFKQVTQLAKKSPEGPINQGRVLFIEGQVDRGLEILKEAEQRRPGYLKSAYFRGALNKKLGAYDEALADWKKVAEAYPNDRVLLLDLGRTEYLAGRYEEALQWIDLVLKIDPEDLGGLYNRMLALGALGREAEFTEARKLYEYHKDDEDAMAATATFKQNHPAANNEAQPIHAHPLLLIDQASGRPYPTPFSYNALSASAQTSSQSVNRAQ